MVDRGSLLGEMEIAVNAQKRIRLRQVEPAAPAVLDEDGRQMARVAVRELPRGQMELTDQCRDEHHRAVVQREDGVDLFHDDVGGRVMPDGRAEERDGGGHEHRRRHTFPTDVTDDEGDIIAVPVKIVQVAPDTPHRHERRMESELVVIYEIVHQDAGLNVLGQLHLLLHQLMMILNLQVRLLVQSDPAEQKDENHDSDDQDEERDDASPFDALPDDAVRNDDHQLHVDWRHRLRIDQPVLPVVPVPHLILRRHAVGRGDERAVGAVDEAYGFVVRLDILQDGFHPLDREIVPHDADQLPLSVFYPDRMGSDQRLRAGADIRLRPIAIAVAFERTGVPVAPVIIQTISAPIGRDGLAMEAIRSREIIVHPAAIHARRQLDEHIVNVRIAVEHLAGRLQHFLFVVSVLEDKFPHFVSSVVEAHQNMEEILLRQLHFVFHHFAHMLLLKGR